MVGAASNRGRTGRSRASGDPAGRRVACARCADRLRRVRGDAGGDRNHQPTAQGPLELPGGRCEHRRRVRVHGPRAGVPSRGAGALAVRASQHTAGSGDQGRAGRVRRRDRRRLRVCAFVRAVRGDRRHRLGFRDGGDDRGGGAPGAVCRGILLPGVRVRHAATAVSVRPCSGSRPLACSCSCTCSPDTRCGRSCRSHSSSLASCVLYERTGAIWSSIALHVAYNAAAFMSAVLAALMVSGLVLAALAAAGLAVTRQRAQRRGFEAVDGRSQAAARPTSRPERSAWRVRTRAAIQRPT